jgi:hypothetical protein
MIALCPSPSAEVVDAGIQKIPAEKDVTTRVQRDGSHTLMVKCGSVMLPVGMHPAFRPRHHRAVNVETPFIIATPSPVVAKMLDAA